MQQHIITKEDGSRLNWSIANNNKSFCLLYKDNNQKYTFTPNEDLNCELFMIGGGGAGGYFFGGGGGAGAAYINNNYTFKRNKTYTFEIGSGGMCDIENINKLFKTGLTLTIYNNTTVNLNNVNFMYDDYSSLGIENSGMKQSFNVNNITIPATIFNKNTTYIWDGYIKSNSDGYFNIIINSKINTIIWIDKYIFNNANSLIEGNNLNDVKMHKLEANRYYNIKIIAYNNDSTSNNLNITFEGCQLFNFDKNEEKYIYKQSTDTIITYQNDNNTLETLRCKGGGNGGCGFYNKNTTLDGGCGGGSGINRIKGSSIIEAIYNGYDGAVGEYCGGGGGIISAGNNNKGGNGKIINWFRNDLIFGAGGNAANYNDARNLGYGSGGNGGECCYYSKLLINNNGNNGCILIYINSPSSSSSSPAPSTSSPIIEGFSNKTSTMLPKNSIAKKLIDQSFSIAKYNSYLLASSRKNYFGEGTVDENAFVFLANDYDNSRALETSPHEATNYLIVDTFMNQTFIYDMLVISKLFGILYRLYSHHFNNTLISNLNDWNNFIANAKIKFLANTAAATTTHNIANNDVTIYDFNSIVSLQLGTAIGSGALNTTSRITDYNNAIYKTASTTVTDSKIAASTINAYILNEGNNVSALSPLYHNIVSGAYINVFNEINAEILARKYYKIETIEKVAILTPPVRGNFIGDVAITYASRGIPNINTSAASTQLKILDSTVLNRDYLKTYYEKLILVNEFNEKHAEYKKDNYLNQRVFLYLEVFNIILNTPANLMLPTLKYWMHYYNLVAYNASIQYKLLNIQNSRVNSTSAETSSKSANTACHTDNSANQNLIPKYIISEVAAGSSCPSGGGVLTSTALKIYNTFGTPASAIPDLNIHIDILNNNITEIIKSFNDSTAYTMITNNILTTSELNKNSSDNYYNEQLSLNKTINDYNNELENYNNLSYYYKIVIAFGIVLLLLIIIIFNYSGIDNNSKISIYAIIIILIIIAYIIYNQYSGVKEGFTAVESKSNITAPKDLPAIFNFYKYKETVGKYMNALLNVITNNSLNGTMSSSLSYIKRISSIKNDKAEYYKVKKMNLINSIEVLKKTSNYYYYIIILIAFSIIIFNIGIILYLLSPNNIIQILILCLIPFIILIYYISYQIHKSTRLAENKNYWANYNPSDNTLKNL